MNELLNARFDTMKLLIARQDFDSALAAAAQHIAAQSRQVPPVSPTAGLHWLRGLLLLRDGRITPSILAFARELDELPDDRSDLGGIRINAQIGAGFAHLAARDPVGAIDVFRLALETMPRNARALIGLQHAFRQTSLAAEADQLTWQIDRAIAEASVEAQLGDGPLVVAAARLMRGDIDLACRTLRRFLAEAPPGPSGWLIPIDPALSALRAHPEYPHLMAMLAARAA